jgi:phage tail-like protein
MAKTATPTVDRATIFEATTQISGTLNEEVAGTIIYIYLNMRRIATAFTTAYTATQKRWIVSTSDFVFGGGIQRVKRGDRLYVQAKAVGKDKSDPTIVYIVGGIDQPCPPYVQEDPSQEKTAIYERQRYIAGDVPLLNGITPFNADIPSRVAEGVTISIYVNGTFLATTQSNKVGHWTFDLYTVQDSPLLPLEKNDLVTARATRYSVAEDGTKTEVLAPSAESQPAEVLGSFFQTRLFDYLPATMRDEDVTGDLKNFTKILAVTQDEVKSLVDQFTDIFDIDHCDPKYFDALAYLLGYPLNRLDSIESQRFQIRNAVELWKWKGTFEVFKILFYMLDYDITIQELWTNDYELFFPTVMNSTYTEYVYTDDTGLPVDPPDDAPELLENGGTWYKSPYFGVRIEPLVEMGTTPTYPYQTDPVNCPTESNAKAISFSPEDLKYLMERIDYFRPAHTVLDYIMFVLPLVECGPIPEEHIEWDVDWYPEEPGWYLPYCLPDDPIYYRDGLRSTRPDGKGLLILGVTRDPDGLHPSTDPTILMKRLPERGYCHPGETLEWYESPTEEENYYFVMKRDGLGIGGYPVGEDIGTVDINDWPSRNSFDPPTRNQTYRYASRLVVTLTPV